jgi:hypothetical protein
MDGSAFTTKPQTTSSSGGSATIIIAVEGARQFVFRLHVVARGRKHIRH